MRLGTHKLFLLYVLTVIVVVNVMWIIARTGKPLELKTARRIPRFSTQCVLTRLPTFARSPKTNPRTFLAEIEPPREGMQCELPTYNTKHSAPPAWAPCCVAYQGPCSGTPPPTLLRCPDPLYTGSRSTPSLPPIPLLWDMR